MLFNVLKRLFLMTGETEAAVKVLMKDMRYRDWVESIEATTVKYLEENPRVSLDTMYETLINDLIGMMDDGLMKKFKRRVLTGIKDQYINLV